MNDLDAGQCHICGTAKSDKAELLTESFAGGGAGAGAGVAPKAGAAGAGVEPKPPNVVEVMLILDPVIAPRRSAGIP